MRFILFMGISKNITFYGPTILISTPKHGREGHQEFLEMASILSFNALFLEKLSSHFSHA